jgi:hypothetical protein
MFNPCALTFDLMTMLVFYREEKIGDVERTKMTMTSVNWFFARTDRNMHKSRRCLGMVVWKHNALTGKSDWHTFEGRCGKRFVRYDPHIYVKDLIRAGYM